MANEVHYYDVAANGQHNCEVMLKSKLQCPTRAVIGVPAALGGQTSYYCRHHFELEKHMNPDTKYIYHDSTGAVASDVDKEYVPPQK